MPLTQRPALIIVPVLPERGLTFLRVLEGAVIDFPAPMFHPNARVWVATCWPDPTQPGGWARALWWPSPYHRGYQPVALTFADVIEFGADIPIKRGHKTRWVPVRWYGIVLRGLPNLLVAYGSYGTPNTAHTDARQLIHSAACHGIALEN